MLTVKTDSLDQVALCKSHGICLFGSLITQRSVERCAGSPKLQASRLRVGVRGNQTALQDHIGADQPHKNRDDDACYEPSDHLKLPTGRLPLLLLPVSWQAPIRGRDRLVEWQPSNDALSAMGGKIR